MRTGPVPGEVGLALLFALVGVAWTVGAFNLPFWEGFAPQSGFVPLFYGLLLTGLSLAILAGLFIGHSGQAELEPVGKPLLLVAALIGAVAGMPVVGFETATFLLLVVLYVGVERLPIVRSLTVAALTTVALTAILKGWLGVPLPEGPFGI